MTQTLAPAPASNCQTCTVTMDGKACFGCGTVQPVAAPAKQTPVEKRIDFIKNVTKPVNDRALATIAADQLGQVIPDLTLDEFIAVAVAMSEGENLGRTDRWKNACRWALNEIAIQKASAEPLDAKFARWAVVQGSVWMAHAAD